MAERVVRTRVPEVLCVGPRETAEGVVGIGSAFTAFHLGTRDEQQDRAIAVEAEDANLYVVADGYDFNFLGGGAEAAEKTVRGVAERYYKYRRCGIKGYGEIDVTFALYLATGDVARTITRGDATIVAAVAERLANDGVMITHGHAGDSRLYFGDVRYADHPEDALWPRTTDHTWVKEQVDKGLLEPERTADHPHRNKITHSMLKISRGKKLEVRSFVVAPENLGFTYLLLVSDGLNTLTPLQIAGIVHQHWPNRLEEVPQVLVNQAYMQAPLFEERDKISDNIVGVFVPLSKEPSPLG